ncbi:MAG TPA: NAD-dependent epimerase/dehydratase family protein, partial [bacterium]|nr:NAD-dependent epimerase/dehydratase family protein [bacterium]
AEEHRLNESHETVPDDFYGISKLTGEHMTRVWAKRVGMRYKIMRLFNVYGPGDPHQHVIPEIIRQVKLGETKIKLGNLKPKRDFIFVGDVVDAMMCFLERVDLTTTVNVGTGIAYSPSDLVEAVGSVVGERLECITTKEKSRKHDPPCLMADILRMSVQFGWQPKVPMSKGLRQLLEYETV